MNLSTAHDSTQYPVGSRAVIRGTALEPDSQGHREHHKTNSDILRDTIIGFADGLTVPFALTAGLSA